ncbi:polysaccharide biosynthesis/export family protein [Flavobacterium lacus]|uniref:Polysaccharide export outer membrane protein n=1 Tax=Flavobacterium lacus TaxID=1353778 RepID=A0A328WM94_9FLAO|nr:polysaccharide biosynthesis/export family protein [Flavobacterium lacus]RAR47253.1 polysaccharide export outer membrane protein [Flavobacterium lacus]
MFEIIGKGITKRLSPGKGEHVTKFFIFIVILLSITSCATKKNVLYLNDLDVNKTDTFKWSDFSIQSGDIVSILITSDSPELSAVYNVVPPQQPGGMQGDMMNIRGHLVTSEGFVTIPVLGSQKIKGLTLERAQNQIQNELIDKGFLKNPVVICRLLNSKVTVLGEVRSPGTYTFYENNMTLLQALGLAGDLTIKGERKEIRIVRIEDGIQTYGSIDLTKKDWFTSPFYFIKPNDVIIVNPNISKVKASGIIENPGNFIGLLSVILSTYIIIKNL